MKVIGTLPVDMRIARPTDAAFEGVLQSLRMPMCTMVVALGWRSAVGSPPAKRPVWSAIDVSG